MVLSAVLERNVSYWYPVGEILGTESDFPRQNTSLNDAKSECAARQDQK